MMETRSNYFSPLKNFASKIRSLPSRTPLTKEDLLKPDFLLSKNGNLEIYYAPHNEYINEKARVLIVGITPGWTQMEIAYRRVRDDLLAGIPLEEASKRAKHAARFAGSMRKNLVEMLDELGLGITLGIGTCGELFDESYDLLHTTSMLKYPVFVRGKNYTGHSPKLLKSPLLLRMAEESLTAELHAMQEPLIIPLGKTVEDVLRRLVEAGLVNPRHCLFGFPHPSGANGHRRKQFMESQAEMVRVVEGFFGV